jgi:hypothetical protein
MENSKTMNETVEAAEVMWAAMNSSEKHGVRFGLFPAVRMRAAEKLGYNGLSLTVALMRCAEKDGGMRG